ncbi:terminase large subunit [Microbispora triticiradicis]|uniref:terminase large subunit n=1 Tax=Microbispora triticiradicis TaxID=2200763 RepID=UPI001AD7A099|nr:terminase large subunit [Microbispora triticiradicis]
MTISPPDVLHGAQTPRLLVVPPRVSSAGAEAVELAASAGLMLDPWQSLVLEEALGERPDGKWSAFEVGVIVSRQNGKGSILEARELAGLYLFGEELILHSAHEFKTAQEAFRRVLGLIQSTPDLDRRVMRVRTSHGEEGVELKGGARLRFVARSTGSGRGFSGDCVILDEAYNLPDASVDALMPTMSARPNPQLWYTSSAPDKDLAPCDQLARVRRRALAGGDPGLAYFEWSIDPHDDRCTAACTLHDDTHDPVSWTKANPGMGIRISVEHVARERVSMSAAGFARERLGVGNYPADGDGWSVISEAAWTALADERSELVDPVAFALDVTPDRSYGAIAVAGRRPDGLEHVEVVDHHPGTGWMVQRMAELDGRWNPCAVVVDGGSPAGSLIADLEAAGVEVLKPSARAYAQACGALYDAVVPREGNVPTLRHLGQAPLSAALAGAEKRDLADLWAWTRKGVSVDISPLVAVTLARWGHATNAHLIDNSDPMNNIW